MHSIIHLHFCRHAHTIEMVRLVVQSVKSVGQHQFIQVLPCKYSLQAHRIPSTSFTFSSSFDDNAEIDRGIVSRVILRISMWVLIYIYLGHVYIMTCIKNAISEVTFNWLKTQSNIKVCYISSCKLKYGSLHFLNTSPFKKWRSYKIAGVLKDFMSNVFKI